MIGRPRVHHAVTDSTNERAKELARAGAHHGTLVTAGEQTAGRGRQGREWVAPAGSAVLMSVVIREPGELLPLTAALAVCDACAPLECEIKWPNDVWVEGRKIAGILVEGRPQEGWAVLGVGLNVLTREFPPELQGRATSLALQSSVLSRQSSEVVLGSLLGALDAWLVADSDSVMAAWRERDALKGRTITWDGGTGTAAGIDDSGALLVETDEGHVALHAGEVHLQVGQGPDD